MAPPPRFEYFASGQRMEYLEPVIFVFWRAALATLCGGIIGLERQVRGKAAGVRTSILICFGTSIFVHLGAVVAGPGVEPARVIGQVVTGVGFLGAGVMMTQDGIVRGVTTAAVIWMLAAIGATIGAGYYAAAIASSVVTVAILTGIDFLEGRVAALTRGVHALEQDADNA
jgi:putative Mg2+ transporter-C (MgtC) family protein